MPSTTLTTGYVLVYIINRFTSLQETHGTCQQKRVAPEPRGGGPRMSTRLGDPRLGQQLRAKLRIPVMAGPMFIASTAELVIAQCRAGIIGAMPALNPRSTAALDTDIGRIKTELAGCPIPYAINLVAHRS